MLFANTAHRLLVFSQAISIIKIFSFQSARRDQATDCAGFLLSDSLGMVDQQELRGRGGGGLSFNLLFLLQKKKKKKKIKYN